MFKLKYFKCYFTNDFQFHGINMSPKSYNEVVFTPEAAAEGFGG